MDLCCPGIIWMVQAMFGGQIVSVNHFYLFILLDLVNLFFFFQALVKIQPVLTSAVGALDPVAAPIS